MKKYLKLLITFTALSSFLLQGCYNLKPLHEYSTTSSNAIKKFEDIKYSSKQYCLNRCQLKAIKKNEIMPDLICDFRLYEQADSITQLIYHQIENYFEALTYISDKNLNTFNNPTPGAPLTTGKFGDITIDSTDVHAYSALSANLFNLSPALYHKRKLEKYLASANLPLQILSSKFLFILHSNLERKLNGEKEDLYNYYKGIINEKTLPDQVKGVASIEYYKRLSEIKTAQNQFNDYTKNMKIITDGYQHTFNEIKKSTVINWKDISISLNGGFNFSGIRSLNENFLKTIKNNLNLFPGSYSVTCNLKLTKVLSLQTEIDFEKKGYTSEFQYSDNYMVHNNIPLDYITLPLLLNLKLGKNVKYFANAGLYFGFLTNKNYFEDNYLDEPSGYYPNSYYDYYEWPYPNPKLKFNSFDFGFIAGMGIEIPILTKLNILVQGRYNFGISNIITSDLPYVNRNNYSVSGSIGIVYYLNEKY